MAKGDKSRNIDLFTEIPDGLFVRFRGKQTRVIALGQRIIEGNTFIDTVYVGQTDQNVANKSTRTFLAGDDEWTLRFGEKQITFSSESHVCTTTLEIDHARSKVAVLLDGNLESTITFTELNKEDKQKARILNLAFRHTYGSVPLKVIHLVETHGTESLVKTQCDDSCTWSIQCKDDGYACQECWWTRGGKCWG